MSRSSKQLKTALAYAKNGIKVFPCRLANKRPITKNGFYDATTDVAVIEQWWKRNPNALVGSPNDQFTVIDVDDKGLCPAGKMLTDNAVSRLFETLHDDCMVVKTISGGFHVYYRKHEKATRRINFLPNIDLLGFGGYVILPDQENYISDKNPWDMITRLPEFPFEEFSALSTEMTSARALARQLKRQQKTARTNVNADKKPKKKLKKSVGNKEDTPAIAEIIEKFENSQSVNYSTGQIILEQTPDMYKAKEVPVSADPLEKILVDGKLPVEAGIFDTALINRLFHNIEVQSILGNFLGLRIPSLGDKNVQRSVIPGHEDLTPSMGVRWSKKGTHLLVRDFANYFGDVYEQNDYNVVRLYATMRYKAQAPRLKSPEFVVWFLRMLVDAGVIDVKPLKKKYSMPSCGMPGIQKVANGIQLLDAIKQLYKGYDGSTTFSDRFASAWCAVDPSTANRAKKYLFENGYLCVDGTYDCSGGLRDDGFFNTKVFSIIDHTKRDEINKKEEVKTEDSMGDIVSIKGVRVTQKSFERIKNFCTDYDIENVPERENMFVEVGVVEGLSPNDIDAANIRTFTMENLELVVTDAMAGGGQILMLVGDSIALEELFDQNIRNFRDLVVISEEPNIAFPICFDYEPGQYDLESLSLRVNEYLEGYVSLDEQFIKYTNSKDLFDYILDGRMPEDE